jgi:endonuclease/exonuclease/phosphatase (EEP) superfamily protein YafD
MANCHGLNFVTEKSFRAQLDDLFSSLEAGSNSGPAIVCGDFNVWSSSRLAALEERVRASGLIEASADDHSGPDTPTFLRALTPLVGYDPGIPLDRIYTRGLKVLGCRSVKGLESSDHAPLVLEFAVGA